jgi:hypothetical protein
MKRRCRVSSSQTPQADVAVAVTSAAVVQIWPDVQIPKYEASRTAWLLTCVDLTSLLVAFFLLLFSLQTLQADKWEAVTGSFQQQFAKQAAVVPVIADSSTNAVVHVTGVKSGLAYLDTLLGQRIKDDAVWGGLRSGVGRQAVGRDLAYVLPTEVLVSSPVNDAAWGRLGSAMRGWKNPVGVRVTAPKAETWKVSKSVVELSGKLAGAGVNGVFAEVIVAEGKPAKYELVVRAQ